MESPYEPQSLQEAIVYFSDAENCLNYLVARRPEWKNGVVCPRCGSTTVGFLKNQLRWQCSVRHPRRQFSIKVDTIFEDSPIGLDKWLPAMWLINNCKNGISSCEIARSLDVTQKTAWFMLHRIRLTQQGKNGSKLGGPGKEIEADETMIGGKARNMHPSKRAQMRACKNFGKTIVSAVLERHGKVRATVIPNRKKKAIQEHVREHVEAGSTVYSDELKSYAGMDEFTHDVINHAECYVNGRIHTNGMENFWSLLKRSLKGTYVSVEPYHLFRYVDEQAFRYNNRKMDDSTRFDTSVRGIVGKRVTYAELIGKAGETAEVF